MAEGAWTDQPVEYHNDFSTFIQNTCTKVCTYLYASDNLHLQIVLYSTYWTKNIILPVRTGEKTYFFNLEGTYYNFMPYIWKSI